MVIKKRNLIGIFSHRLLGDGQRNVEGYHILLSLDGVYTSVGESVVSVLSF